MEKVSKKPGEKFTSRYKKETANIYKDSGTLDRIEIPGPDHPLYDPTAPTVFDPIRVEAIDADGTMTDPIEVWTDPDRGILWVLDGRGRFLDVQEVNRRRAADGRALVKPYLVPFPGDEKEAVARVRQKNYHRRLPTPSGMARDLLVLRKRGFSCAECAKILHHDTTDPEQWVRKLLPLAYCVPEVQRAVDAGDLPRSAVRRFAGAAADGSEALGKQTQIALLADLQRKKPIKTITAVTPAARERARQALTNGGTAQLKSLDRLVARVAAAVLARVGGDASALRDWPDVAAIFEGALVKKAVEKVE